MYLDQMATRSPPDWSKAIGIAALFASAATVVLAVVLIVA
jgi:hypothetical protein